MTILFDNIANYIKSKIQYPSYCMKIFFSGPLTNLKNPAKTKAFYSKIDAAAKTLGYETFWAFLSGTDPVSNPEVSAGDVFRRDIKALAESDLMVSYAGEPSTGTGIEIGFAAEHDIPVVIFYEMGKKVSRMLRGCPAIKKEIVYTDETDAVSQISSYLQREQS